MLFKIVESVGDAASVSELRFRVLLLKSSTRRVVGAEASRVALPMLLFTLVLPWCKVFEPAHITQNSINNGTNAQRYLSE